MTFKKQGSPDETSFTAKHENAIWNTYIGFAHPSSKPWADNEQGWGRIKLQQRQA
ncbi:hypothetical protein [Nostoc sp.]|uniref:hypothetical protein n=1 Tax=Nostoc sp. TaxID=1180 RepID=UPI002FF6664A